jgi:hypothetical protein
MKGKLIAAIHRGQGTGGTIPMSFLPRRTCPVVQGIRAGTPARVPWLFGNIAQSLDRDDFGRVDLVPSLW